MCVKHAGLPQRHIAAKPPGVEASVMKSVIEKEQVEIKISKRVPEFPPHPRMSPPEEIHRVCVSRAWVPLGA